MTEAGRAHTNAARPAGRLTRAARPIGVQNDVANDIIWSRQIARNASDAGKVIES